MSKHPHYELLNLIGYGLAKFDDTFIKEFQCSSKSEFYRYIVSLCVAETTGVVKNRMDLFDPYFDNNRKGWWQKAEVYRFRKDLIDTMFGNEDVQEHSYLAEVKCIRKTKGRIRLTAKEFEKAKEYQSDFILSLVTNLDDIPRLVLIDNPLKHFQFEKNVIKNEVVEYRSLEDLY